jgi:UMP-CMP kinase
MQHLSAGELLRAERETGSANGVLIDSLIKEGKIVPVEITVDLIRQAMEASECSRFLVDGFPRNEDNVNGWEKNMRNEAVVESVIFIECAEAELEKRVVNRGLTSGRSDDNLSTVRKRFATFYDSTMPIVKYFQEMKKVVTVQGDQSKEKVFNEMSDVIIPYIQDDILGLSQRLLVATSSADWETFSTLCDPQITSLLPEHEGVSSGLMALQSRFMDEALMGKSVMLDPVVQVLGTTAIASYRREFTQGAGEVSGQCNESRVWHQVDGEWKLVHYHRSLASKVQ